MALFGLIDPSGAAGEAGEVFDDIRATRKTERINHIWRALAHSPALLRQTWQAVKSAMAPGEIDPLTKEMLYLAVSISNQCEYCTASHGAAARAKGMTQAMFGELVSIVATANATNRLAIAYGVPPDDVFAHVPAPPPARDTVERCVTAVLEGQESDLREILTEDFVMTLGGETIRGAGELIAHAQTLRQAAPGLKWTTEHCTAIANFVTIVGCTSSGVRGMAHFQLAGGRIQRVYALADRLAPRPQPNP